MTTLAFLITAHNDPVHLKRLTDSLPENAHFFVHVDAKSDIESFIKTITNPRVHFVQHRVNVMWGSLGVVDSQMYALNEALEYDVDFDYFISMSGLDYPLWSNERIDDFFSAHPGREYLYGICMKNQNKQVRDLYLHYRFFNSYYWPYGSLGSKFRVSLRELTFALGFRKPLSFVDKDKRYDLYKGAMWWAITRDLAAFAYDTWKNNKMYVEYFKTSFAPDETFIPTLVFNTEFRSRALPSPKTFTDLESITPLTFIDYTHGIKILDESDLPRLIASNKMFCRKTITGQSDRLMDLIDERREG